MTSQGNLTRKSMEPWLLDSVQFYQHQIEGIRKLMRMKSFLLADDMGLGKSLQALTVFIGDVFTGVAQIGVVICPVSLRSNWANEIEKFTRVPYTLLGEEVNPVNGKVKTLSPGERVAQLVNFAMQMGPRILILNYEQVAPHLDELNALNIDIAIFDEAHYIKGANTKRTKACLALKTKRSFLLTGSPILNQVDDLWPILNRIAPKHFPNFYAFRNRYCVFGGYKNKAVVGAKNVKELHQILDQVMVRRLKKDVLDLPEVQYINVYVDLHPEQQRLYDQAEEEEKIENIDPDAPPMEIQNAVVKFKRLLQICGTPATLGFPDESYKLDAVVERAKEVIGNGNKLIIFTQFRKVLECTARRLRAEDIRVVELHGDIPKHERQVRVDYWSSDPKPCVILCMTQVAGIGLNMTAARHIFFIDKLFAPKLNDQAVDRAHRIGQDTTQPVQVTQFIARRTKEERVEQIINSKKKTFDNVIESTSVMRRILEELSKTK